MAKTRGHNAPLKYAPEVHVLMVAAYLSQLETIQQVFSKVGFVNTVFVYRKFYNKIHMYILVGVRCLLVARKKNLTGVSTGLTDPSKNLDPTHYPTGRSTRPVSLPAAGQFFVIFFFFKAILMPLDHISQVFRPIWKN